MISMKKDQKEIAEDKAEYIGSGPQDEYPYGLRICLDDDSMAKLGLTGTFELGRKLTLNATVEVVSSSKRETDEGPEFNMDLQITEMELNNENTNSDRANRLYKD